MAPEMPRPLTRGKGVSHVPPAMWRLEISPCGNQKLRQGLGSEALSLGWAAAPRRKGELQKLKRPAQTSLVGLGEKARAQ